MAHYLVYWKPSTVAYNKKHGWLGHSASNQYHKLAVGDVLWIVTSEAPEHLLLVGRQRVGRIVGQTEAERILGKTDLWVSEYHVFCDDPEEKAYLDISPWAAQLVFDGVVKCLPERFTGQHFQTMRRLSFESANLIKQLWARQNDPADS